MEANAEAQVQPKPGLNWPSVIWVGLIHAGVLLAPFTITWSGLAICGVLYVLCGLGITLGYHRLLTHRSFRTPRWLEYVITVLGVLANQGGPLTWAASHRRHHVFADEEGDPHSPKDGSWWSHMVWWMHEHPVLDHPDTKHNNVKDLARDPFIRLIDRYHFVPAILLGVILYVAGELYDGIGLSWLVWGIFVRTVLLYHATWLVNSATHMWGYRNFETRDLSTNLWWVAILSLGEGWHNNHHAYQRSARHGLRWWEFDFTYLTIRTLSFVGLAREIHVAPPPTSQGPARRCRVLRPRRRTRKPELSIAT